MRKYSASPSRFIDGSLVVLKSNSNSANICSLLLADDLSANECSILFDVVLLPLLTQRQVFVLEQVPNANTFYIFEIHFCIYMKFRIKSFPTFIQ